MNIYEKCPLLESERFILRTVYRTDCEDLVKVYGDKNALPFFNSDNCHGDNFYYATRERMEQALDFWEMSYENGWFARLSIVDKPAACVIGTVELCLRDSENLGILRIDVRSDYEREDALYEIASLITPQIPEYFGCDGVITKAPIYAVERIKALEKCGYSKYDEYIIGENGYAYDGYWIYNT